VRVFSYKRGEKKGSRGGFFEKNDGNKLDEKEGLKEKGHLSKETMATKKKEKTTKGGGGGIEGPQSSQKKKTGYKGRIVGGQGKDAKRREHQEALGRHPRGKKGKRIKDGPGVTQCASETRGEKSRKKKLDERKRVKKKDHLAEKDSPGGKIPDKSESAVGAKEKKKNPTREKKKKQKRRSGRQGGLTLESIGQGEPGEGGETNQNVNPALFVKPGWGKKAPRRGGSQGKNRRG